MEEIKDGVSWFIEKPHITKGLCEMAAEVIISIMLCNVLIYRRHQPGGIISCIHVFYKQNPE